MAQLVWSKDEFYLSEFERRYGDSLPVVIFTTSGFDGGDSLHAISSGETLFVDAIERQQRTVLEDSKGHLYSFPVNCPFKFCLISNKNFSGVKSAAVTLSEAISLSARDPQTWGVTPSVMLDHNDDALFVVGDGTGSRVRLGMLRLVDTFDEIYLVARTITDGCNSHMEDQLVPANMKISAVVAVNLLGDNSTTSFKAWLSAMRTHIRSTRKHNTLTSQHVEIVRLRPVVKSSVSSQGSLAQASETIYERLEPLIPVECSGEYEQLSVVVKRCQSVAESSTANKLRPRILPDSIYLTPTIPRDTPRDIPARCLSVDSVAGELKAKLNQHSTFSGRKMRPLMPKPPAVAPVESSLSRLNDVSHRPPSDDRATVNDNKCSAVKVTTQWPAETKPKAVGKMESMKQIIDRVDAASADSATDQEARMRTSISIDVTQLSTSGVSDCLRQLRLDKFVDAFQAMDVDGMLLSSLDEQILLEDLAMSRIEARKLTMFVKEGWRPKKDEQ